MTPYQEKYSQMKNYESRIKKYKEKLNSLNDSKDRETNKQVKVKIAKDIVGILQALKEEMREYRKLKSELRHKFPGEGKKTIISFPNSSDEDSGNTSSILYERSEDRSEEGELKLEDAQAQKEKEALNKELSKFHKELFKVYAISEEQRRAFREKYSESFPRGLASEKNMNLKKTSLKEVFSHEKKSSSIEESMIEKSVSRSVKGKSEEEGFQAFEKIIIEK